MLPSPLRRCFSYPNCRSDGDRPANHEVLCNGLWHGNRCISFDQPFLHEVQRHTYFAHLVDGNITALPDF
jgi:hypothetical protein